MKSTAKWENIHNNTDSDWALTVTKLSDNHTAMRVRLERAAIRWKHSALAPKAIRSFRHAGLVPASTVQHIQRHLGLRPGGPRHKAGVTIELSRVQL